MQESKEMEVCVTFEISCTQEEESELKRILDHHIEYLLSLDEFPEIKNVKNVKTL